jgi:hypothetical protein
MVRARGPKPVAPWNQGSRVTSVVSLRLSAHSSDVPTVVSVDMPRLVDAFHCNREVTYPCDAPASHAVDEIRAEQAHQVVTKISRIHGDVFETDD